MLDNVFLVLLLKQFFPGSVVNNTFSCGVPQGSALDLFCLPSFLLKQQIKYTKGISYHRYADDIQLYSASSFGPLYLDISFSDQDSIKK